MPAKTTKTKKPAARSNVAKSSTLNKKRKFNWKIVAAIAVVLVAVLGFLYVRLSKAASFEMICTSPQMVSNCYYPVDRALGHTGGQILGKTDGTVSWAGTANTSITFADKLYADSTRTYKYCFYVQFGAAATGWTIDWRNTTTGTHSSRTGSDAISGGSQTVRCTDAHNINGSGLTNQEVKFIVTSGSAVVYKMTRVWTEAAVTQPAPGSKITPAPSAPAPTTTTNQCTSQTFSQGSQGSCVTIIQNRLKDLGYAISTVDGVYGSNTTSAVKVFQSRNGLSQDGVVGPQTWSKLTDPNAARKS